MLDKISTALGALVVAAFLAWIFSACTTVDQKLDPSVYYRRDMLLDVNGHKGEGVLVVPKSGQYQISGRARGVLDLFTLTTCHRETIREGLEYEFNEKLYPVRGIEDGGGCVISLGGYEKKRGRHSWGFIDIQDESTNLPALIKCNGVVSASKGVSVCQSREGLLQAIEFQETVDVAPTSQCPMPMPEDRKTFVFEIAPKECVYAFLSKSGRFHRLTTLGYKSILLRED